MGRKTGLHSYRSIVFKNFPRSGVPRVFSSNADYLDLVDTLVRTKSIPDASKLWWDVRPNHSYPTLEFRICDVCTRVDEAVCLAALFQAIIAKLWKLRRDNLTFRVYPGDLIEENKWRAVRYGLDGKLIDFGRKCEVETRSLIQEILDFIAPEADELGSQREMQHIDKILRGGTGADRQLAVWERTQDMKAVVDQIVAETYEGLGLDEAGPLTPAPRVA